MKYFLALSKQASTWRGLMLLLTSYGIAINPEQQTAILTLGLAIAGAIGAFFPDNLTDVTSSH